MNTKSRMFPKTISPVCQIHLDFHTSEHIADIGRDFDPREFQASLKLGRVKVINVFAKCHHSWSYYPTKVGRPHPHLKRDLLGGMIEAAHEIGVQAPIYFTIGWSAAEAAEHPEWHCRDRQGNSLAFNVDPAARGDMPRPNSSWVFLCPTGDYLDLILRQTRELCRRYPVDGFWYDICVFSRPCYCARCRTEMQAHGENPDDEAAARRQLERTWTRLMRKCNAIIHRQHPKAAIYYNGTTGIGAPKWYTAFCTRLELEDLPTTWGGYDKLPLRARFHAASGKDQIAMSGKFHTSWGEFGGFKPADAMRAEAAAMIANGAACCFGDQLHPHGRMDPETYRLIGEAFEYAERIAPYGRPGQFCANLGLWLSGGTKHDEGVAKMLHESQLDFEVVHPDTDLKRFDAVILTGDARLAPAQADRLRTYAAQGGGVLLLSASGFDPAGREFAFSDLVRDPQPARFDCDYLVVNDPIAAGMVRSPVLCYAPAWRVTPAPDAKVLARIQEPFFRRTYATYCSHMNTPPCGQDAAHPAAVWRGRVVYLAHPVGQMYLDHGARQHRQYFLNALRLVYRDPILEVRLPSCGRVSLRHQPEQRRYVAHLLYTPPIPRGRCLVLEDAPPLYRVPVALKVPERIRSVRLPLMGKTLAARRAAGRVSVVVPKLTGHQIVEFRY